MREAVAGTSWAKLLDVNSLFGLHGIFVVADTEIETREVKELDSVPHSPVALFIYTIYPGDRKGG